MDKEIIETLIKIDNSYTIIVNLEKKKIDVFYADKKIINKNISFKEFSEEFCKQGNFTDETGGKLFRFLTNFTTTEEEFSIQMTCQYKNLENEVYIVIGKKLEKNRYAISIRKNKRNINKTYDALTKVFTYNIMKEKLNDDLKANRKLVLMLINIDNFKEINSIYGFIFGDLVLLEVGACIKKELSNEGYVGRVAGDEFIVYKYIDDTSEDAVLPICKKIRNSITNMSKTNIRQAKITATMGAVIVPDQANNLELALAKANRALTRGKTKGGNCFVIYSHLCEDKLYDKPVIPSETLFASSVTNEGKIVSNIFEILNHGGDIRRNIYDCLQLVGTFFQLDRVCITYDAHKSKKLEEYPYIEWINPYRPELNGLLVEVFRKQDFNIIQDEYKKVIDRGIFKIAQIESNKSLGFVYENLKETKTSAIFLNELSYMGETFGVIRYENTERNRFWNINDTSPLLIISRILSMAIYKEAEKENLVNLVTYDKLTGIFNYSKWRDEVEEFIETIENYPNYGIVSLNIYAFSNIAVKYGTAVGDLIIKTIADGIRKTEFPGNIYCRVNDDKFLMFIANKTDEEICEIIDSIRDYTKSIFNRLSVKIFAGICIHKDLETVNKCIDNASTALKNANANDETVFFSEELNELEKHKSEIELHMKDALINKEFLLYLQPKVNTITGEVVGAEALTRWNYKFKKLLFPNDFIPIFEETGFITELDYTVFDNVCIFLRNIIDNGYKPIKISVNVSRYQKDFNEYLDKLNEIRNRYNIDPKYLEIEITESMYNENVDSISSFIDELHRNGYFVSMDDFGAGYSNLASLAKLDFDIIKLDKTFCSDINNSKEQIILSFVMNLVKDLDIDVLCEGVETAELVDNLKKLGCFLVQGYFYSKPIPSEEFITKFLKKK